MSAREGLLKRAAESTGSFKIVTLPAIMFALTSQQTQEIIPKERINQSTLSFYDAIRELRLLDRPQNLKEWEGNERYRIVNVNTIARLAESIRNDTGFDRLFLLENLKRDITQTLPELQNSGAIVEHILRKYFGKKYHKIERKSFQIACELRKEGSVSNHLTPSSNMESGDRNTLEVDDSGSKLETIKVILPERELPTNEVHSTDFKDALFIFDNLDEIIEEVEAGDSIFKTLELEFFAILKKLILTSQFNLALEDNPELLNDYDNFDTAEAQKSYEKWKEGIDKSTISQ
jgi:hypothetical protein